MPRSRSASPRTQGVTSAATSLATVAVSNLLHGALAAASGAAAAAAGAGGGEDEEARQRKTSSRGASPVTSLHGKRGLHDKNIITALE